MVPNHTGLKHPQRSLLQVPTHLDGIRTAAPKLSVWVTSEQQNISRCQSG